MGAKPAPDMIKEPKNRRSICVVTGTRAEYGLLYWLMKEIQDDPDLDFQVIVTGAHLSPEFGLTWKQIEEGGFSIPFWIGFQEIWIRQRWDSNKVREFIF